MRNMQILNSNCLINHVISPRRLLKEMVNYEKRHQQKREIGIKKEISNKKRSTAASLVAMPPLIGGASTSPNSLSSHIKSFSYSAPLS